MSIFSHVDGLGERVEECVADSVIEWRDAYAKPGKHVDVFAECIKNVHSEVTLFPAGRAWVTVRINANRKWDDMTSVYMLKRRGSGSWIREGRA